MSLTDCQWAKPRFPCLSFLPVVSQVAVRDGVNVTKRTEEGQELSLAHSRMPENMRRAGPCHRPQSLTGPTRQPSGPSFGRRAFPNACEDARRREPGQESRGLTQHRRPASVYRCMRGNTGPAPRPRPEEACPGTSATGTDQTIAKTASVRRTAGGRAALNIAAAVAGSANQDALPEASPADLASCSGPADPDTGDLVKDLYRAHAVMLIRMAKLLLRDQPSAEDAVQDAFLSLYRALPRLRDHDQLLPYLRAAVINQARSVLRARRRAALRRVRHEAPEWSAESAVLADQERREVMAAVARLPRRAREVLVLRYYLDLPDQEIAAALGVSRGTVSSTASRALTTLARELQEEL
jgi:RNA polymerase sigma-70 factor (sigma-E family)